VHKRRFFRVLLRLGSGDTTLRDCSSVCTPSSAPLAANMSGVRPRLSGLLGLTSSRPSSISTASSNPRSAAYERGVLPPLSGLSWVTSSRPNSTLITLIYASVPDEYPRRGIREGCSAEIIRLLGVGLSPPEENCNNSLESVLSSILERRPAAIIWLVRVDLFPPKQHPHRALRSMLRSMRERRPAVIVWLVGDDFFPPQ